MSKAQTIRGLASEWREHQSLCSRCEGNGLLWADGKAHSPSYQGETRPCPDCGGTGSFGKDSLACAEELDALADAMQIRLPHDGIVIISKELVRREFIGEKP